MIRVSSATARKLTAPRATDGLARAHLRLKEADVTKQVVEFLRAHGWYVMRLQSGLFQRPGSAGRILVGEVGMADHLALRRVASPQWVGHVLAIFLEFKAGGRKARPSQEEWAARMRSMGFLIETVDDLDAFRTYYGQVFGIEGRRL